MFYKNENGYINLLKDLCKSDIKNERNGKTYSMFGNLYKFDISDNKFPLLTTKFISFKNIFYELMWFIKGETNSKLLDNNNVKIWNQNSKPPKSLIQNSKATTFVSSPRKPKI